MLETCPNCSTIPAFMSNTITLEPLQCRQQQLRPERLVAVPTAVHETAMTARLHRLQRAIQRPYRGQGRTWMVNDVCWPANVSARPDTLDSAGSAADCSQASSSHSPLNWVPSANRHTPCPCRLSNLHSPEEFDCCQCLTVDVRMLHHMACNDELLIQNLLPCRLPLA